MFMRKKDVPATGPQTSIRTAADFSQVTIVTVYPNGNREEYGVRRAGHGIPAASGGEYRIMMGMQQAEDLHISRDYFKAGDPDGVEIVRHIDATLKLNKRNVTRWQLTRDLMPKGEGLNAELRNAEWNPV